MSLTPPRIADGEHAPKEAIIKANASDAQIEKIIHHLYPALTNVELKQARENLQRYFEVADDFEQELESRPARELDTQNPRPTIEERSKIKKN